MYFLQRTLLSVPDASTEISTLRSIKILVMRLLLLFVTMLFIQRGAAQNISIIPKPQSVQLKTGTYKLTPDVPLIVQDETDRKAAAFFNDYLQQYYGFQLNIKAQAQSGIRLSTRQFIKAPGTDGYTLSVLKEGISIEGDTYAGTFFGMQSLIQLLPVAVPQTQKPYVFSIPFVAIRDAPRFAYRGMHLDVSRHFFPLSFVKKYIDYIALHKMNFFHCHHASFGLSSPPTCTYCDGKSAVTSSITSCRKWKVLSLPAQNTSSKTPHVCATL